MTKSEKLQSAIALLVAIFALLISVWQGCEQRRHNRYSIRPLLNFDVQSSNETKNIQLANEGLGPAIFKRFSIEIDGQKLDGKDGNPWVTVLEKRGLTNKISQMYYYNVGTIMKPSRTVGLLTWEADSLRVLDITIDIIYESIYEEEFRIRENF